MKTQSFKALSESAKNVMLGISEVFEAAPGADDVDTAAEAEVPEAPEAEVPEAPEAEVPEEAPKKASSNEKPKYAAQCKKDGEETVLLLSKDQLEDMIHENGTKCIVKLYELGKETKVPTVKVKV
jgi:hypothetical protein